MADPESGVVQGSGAVPAPTARRGLSHLLKKMSSSMQQRSAVEIPTSTPMNKQNIMKRPGSDNAESNKRMHELQSHKEVLGKGAAAQVRYSRSCKCIHVTPLRARQHIVMRGCSADSG